MADIFISYSRKDRSSAERLAKALEEQGWSVWWDPQIPAGKTFDEVIEQAIDTAKCILVLWSESSVDSSWVRTEATEGAERGILIPVLIEDVRPPLAFRRIQAANLIEWDGMTSHRALQKLVSDITHILGPPPAVEVEEQSKAAEQTRQVEEETGRSVEMEKQRDAEQSAQTQVEAVPDARKQEPDQSGVSSAGSPWLRKLIPILGVGIVVITIVFAVMNLSERESIQPPVQEPVEPVAQMPSETVEPYKPPPVQTTEVTEPLASEATPDDLQLTPSQWREVQQALNDIGFDAGPSDGVPGAKTISAIAQFQENRGFPPSGQLSEAQYQRLLADAQLAAEGRLVSMAPDMLEIPGGCFQMGSPSDEEGRSDNERQHQVCVDAFKIGRTEVTQQQWREVMGANPSHFKGCDHCPVELVSWDAVQDFLQKLNEKTGKQFRLPTEAEWEYAARAGTSGPFSFQGKISADKVNYNADYSYAGSRKGNYRAKTVPVGSLPANPWGLHEVHGNVWEWTCSSYDENYGGNEKQCADDDDSGRRVIRGGSWDNEPWNLRSAYRYRNYTVYRDYTIHKYNGVGFRLAQD